MPPSDMMFALTPCSRITMNATSTPSGSDKTATSAERRCSRNARHTSATTANSSISLSRRWSTRALDQLGAVVGRHDLDTRRQALLELVELRLHRADRLQAFLPERSTMIPPTTSPSPSSSAMPRRISGPTARARRPPAAPACRPRHHAPDRAEILQRLAGSRGARTMYSASASSSTEPPVSRLASLDRRDHLRQRQVVRLEPRGSTTTWYWRTMPPTVATSATLGTVFSSYLRNQSCSARNCARSCLPRAVDERVLVDPAHAGGVRAERGLAPRRQPALHLVQVLEHARARPVEVGAVLEQHVDERVAEERIAAHGLGAGHRQHRRGQRIGDLVLDDLRRLSRETSCG